eukprot:1194906-Prorocentrum_minimum.AAC.7
MVTMPLLAMQLFDPLTPHPCHSASERFPRPTGGSNGESRSGNGVQLSGAGEGVHAGEFVLPLTQRRQG